MHTHTIVTEVTTKYTIGDEIHIPGPGLRKISGVAIDKHGKVVYVFDTGSEMYAQFLDTNPGVKLQ